MTTVEDKMKLFAKIIFEKVEKDSELKIAEVTEENDKLLETEKQNVIRQAQVVVNQMKKKAENKKNQIVSKARMDAQYALLKKRKEIFDEAVEDIRKMAVEFTMGPNYLGFLEKSIKNAISRVDAKDILIFFTESDLKKYDREIREFIDKYKAPEANFDIQKSEKNFIGGCTVEDKDKTIRVDCSMASIIEDNKGLIGKELMDSLH